MQRWRGLTDLPGGWGRCVVTIGVFDGVHRGHQALISRTVEAARQRDVPSVVLTFDPHPSEVLRPGSHPAQLTTLRRKAELVEELGVDVFAVLPFTPELSRLTADEFVHEILVDKLHAAAVIVGENFTFGHKAAGNVETLRTLGRRFGFVAHGAQLQGRTLPGDAQDDGEITFSSTYVRSCIDAGDVAAAAEALGRPHRLEGIVVRGDGRGHDLGYPTANLSAPRFAAIPADGVYACWFIRSTKPDERLPGAVSVGTNPTFSGRERTVEAFVLDVDEDFYGQHVALDFVARLRGQVRFDSVEGLVAQIGDDVARTRELLGIA
ncbi:bifunctional riboflavin kinase/FAD synthetase [Prauserella sp. PE36]|uniref:Riboflavin biosynthesis protein n=1 Tax=Prauserella endophytica TaxID=1592324 RepID=A0ABY2RVS4_9PSEU|nr:MULTISPECIES: bifunctional riboflavin kinase/FAD synthetase [Prauserella]PXY33666.1 riboflavin biosynthesis protein RibF [Prauserella coralliicola]RBM16462.1 bifunctional riboflavin kinase/FAD synthetase [Prauserella sp. PE36]TKG62591.1 bifunctional riboflavin kinase/FAD synthetase [Prauserella endophytica]